MKKPASPTELGIPGTITETALVLPHKLSYERWAEIGGLLGRMQRGLSFWISDWVEFGSEHYSERFAQALDATGYQSQTLLNIAWVGRAIPRSRRREALSFAHHETVAALEPEDQDHWLSRAEEGETLPNGERKRWSVTRLRAELRALGRKDAPHETDREAAQQDPAWCQQGPEQSGRRDRQPSLAPSVEGETVSDPNEPLKSGDEPGRGAPPKKETPCPTPATIPASTTMPSDATSPDGDPDTPKTTMTSPTTAPPSTMTAVSTASPNTVASAPAAAPEPWTPNPRLFLTIGSVFYVHAVCGLRCRVTAIAVGPAAVVVTLVRE